MDMRSRIHSGQLFLDNCQNLDKERFYAKELMIRFNQLQPHETETKKMIQNQILGREVDVHIETPFHFTYGTNIKFGQHCYVNYNCNFIDDGKIIIGDNVLIGPNVTIVTVGHPINPNYRAFMYTEPVVIQNNCWIGAGVVINGGIEIGENTVIGSGSVVTKNIPKNSVAVGNPCRVIREINEEDKQFYRKGKVINDSELEEVLRINQTT